jgi:sugar (pentulose or hexulose) kinase
VPYDAKRQTIMRAVLEGLARRSAAIVEELEAASGRPYDLVLAAGHPTRIGLWRRLRMAAYGRTMAAVKEPESTAFGAAVMAAQAVEAAGAEALVARRVAWSDESEAGGSRSG